MADIEPGDQVRVRESVPDLKGLVGKVVLAVRVEGEWVNVRTSRLSDGSYLHHWIETIHLEPVPFHGDR